VLIRLIAVVSATILVSATAAFGVEPAPTSDCGSPSDIQDGWVIGAPERQGLDPTFLCKMGKGIAEGHLPNVDSIVVVRHGVLVFERYFGPYDATTSHAGNSMTKSLISLLVGIAVDRGLIGDLDAPVLSFFPEYADLRTPEKDRITLRHLLTMTAGLSASASATLRLDREPYRHALEKNLSGDPGISFEYSNIETELIGAILHKVSGKTVDVLATEEIFGPLGIKDFRWYGRLGNDLPMCSSGLSLRPRDWAKIGQLVLNHGAWDGKQIVSASWIAQSTTEQVKAPKAFAYGFQWWLGRSPIHDRVIEWTAALGFNAQKLIVIPDLDMVVVFNASRESVQMVAPEIELLDQYILPALR
jgi:CubicO group peptidase (beta-lactamase class C family)